MKALVYQAPKTLELTDMPDPSPRDGEVLIRIESVGICGSDMHAYLGHDERRPAPLILGHEAAGVVISGAETGRRVTINPLVACGECTHCKRGQNNLCPNREIISMPPREGAFAQMVSMPPGNLVTVPDDVDLDKAALAEPIACGWHAVRKSLAYLGYVPNQLRALVIGGGAIGVGAALSLQAQGVVDVTLIEPNDDRRNFIASRMDFATTTADRLDSNKPFDIVIDGVGIEATRALACEFIIAGGVIAHIGLGSPKEGLDVRKMTLQEIAFMGCYTYTPQDFRDTAQAIFDGRLAKLDWIETRPLEAGAQAFADILNGAVSHPKIILKP